MFAVSGVEGRFIAAKKPFFVPGILIILRSAREDISLYKLKIGHGFTKDIIDFKYPKGADMIVNEIGDF